MWSTDRAEVLAIAGKTAARARAAGFTTLVDATPNDCGRDPLLLRRIAEDNDLHVVCATGYYHEGEGASGYFRFRSLFADVVAELTDLFVTELTEGIAGTGVRAGVFKVATSTGTITDHERSVLTAAARAQAVTGAPILTHTSHGTMGPEQARLLLDAGADPAKVVIGHMCGNLDRAYQIDTLRHGVGIAYDRIGCNRMFNEVTDDDRMDSIVALMELGYGDRIFLSQDSVAHWQGRDARGFQELPGARHWGISRIADYVVPGLLNRGCAAEDIEQFLAGNVRRLWEG